jgi:hypothetical protein
MSEIRYVKIDIEVEEGSPLYCSKDCRWLEPRCKRCTLFYEPISSMHRCSSCIDEEYK